MTIKLFTIFKCTCYRYCVIKSSVSAAQSAYVPPAKLTASVPDGTDAVSFAGRTYVDDPTGAGGVRHK